MFSNRTKSVNVADFVTSVDYLKAGTFASMGLGHRYSVLQTQAKFRKYIGGTHDQSSSLKFILHLIFFRRRIFRR